MGIPRQWLYNCRLILGLLHCAVDNKRENDSLEFNRCVDNSEGPSNTKRHVPLLKEANGHKRQLVYT